jgi:hypothetical protein
MNAVGREQEKGNGTFSVSWSICYSVAVHKEQLNRANSQCDRSKILSQIKRMYLETIMYMLMKFD